MTAKKASKEEKDILQTYLLQFLNIEKRFPLLPGKENKEAVAGLIGITKEELQESRRQYDEQAKQAALEILKDQEFSELVNKVPFETDDTIAVIGDSITDDVQGWFTILTHVLEIGVSEANFTFINSGISYNTTTEALARIDRDLLLHEPDWVFVALGTFDVQRLNVATNRTLIPLAETWENLDTIQNILEQHISNPVIWITPPPVIRELLKDYPLYNFYIEEQDLNQVRELVSGKQGFIVDPRGKRMGEKPEAWHYLPDGLHPSLTGHIETVKELLKVLGAEKTS